MSTSPIRRRRRLLPPETDLLRAVFEHYPRPNSAMRHLLADRLGMSPRAVQIWFQNRRAKVKRDLMESGRAMLLYAPTYSPTTIGTRLRGIVPEVSVMMDSSVTVPSAPSITMTGTPWDKSSTPYVDHRHNHQHQLGRGADGPLDSPLDDPLFSPLQPSAPPPSSTSPSLSPPTTDSIDFLMQEVLALPGTLGTSRKVPLDLFSLSTTEENSSNGP